MIVNSTTSCSSQNNWPEEGLESVATCPVCGAKERTLLYEGLEDRVFFCAPGKWSLYQCEGCRSAYLDPRPTPMTIGLAYQNYFTHKPTLSKSYKHLDIKAYIKKSLANGYRNFKFGTDFRPAWKIGILAAWLMPYQRANIDSFMRNLPKSMPGQRLLDFGCGSGEFLLVARNLGWNVLGIDLDSKAVQVARDYGLEVLQGGIEQLINENVGKFDGITLSHVIEHVYEPRVLLEACRKLLNPGGWLWLETPNLDSEGHRYFGSNWRDLDPPRHLALFTNSSLKQLLIDAGFSKIETEPYRPVCNMVFTASDAISRGMDPFGESRPSSKLGKVIKRAEAKAKQDPYTREFITLKAWVN